MAGTTGKGARPAGGRAMSRAVRSAEWPPEREVVASAGRAQVPRPHRAAATRTGGRRPGRREDLARLARARGREPEEQITRIVVPGSVWLTPAREWRESDLGVDFQIIAQPQPEIRLLGGFIRLGPEELRRVAFVQSGTTVSILDFTDVTFPVAFQSLDRAVGIDMFVGELLAQEPPVPQEPVVAPPPAEVFLRASGTAGLEEIEVFFDGETFRETAFRLNARGVREAQLWALNFFAAREEEDETPNLGMSAVRRAIRSAWQSAAGDGAAGPRILQWLQAHPLVSARLTGRAR